MSQNQTDKHKTATKTVRNSLPPTLLLTHGDQQEQNECHQVEDLGGKKAGKEKKITKEVLYKTSYEWKERRKKSVSISDFVNLSTPPSPRFLCQENWMPLNEKRINNWGWDWAPGALHCHEGREGAGPHCADSARPDSFEYTSTLTVLFFFFFSLGFGGEE